MLTLFNFPQEIKYLLLIQMTMPSITTSSIIFAMNKADENYALMHTLVTSLLALITIPLLMMAGEFWIIG